MKILAVFYVTASIVDVFEHRYAVTTLVNGDIICVDDKYVEVVTNKGALFMLLFSIVDFFYSFVIILVFYEVPRRWYGMYRKNDKASLLIISNDLNISQVVQDN